MIIKKLDTINQLSKLNFFNLNYSYKENHNDLHVYIGYNEFTKNFEMYTIPEKYDRPEYEGMLASYITTSIIKLTDTSKLPSNPTDYKKRIENWNQLGPTWLPGQVSTSSTVFRAFELPSDYMVTNNNYGIYLALKDNKLGAQKTPDLIVATESSKNVELFNNAMPVPPFPKSSSFYLINLADNLNY